jgi:quercetin dioxygenase-like cupin family protein
MHIQPVALDVVVRALLAMATGGDARTHVEVGGPKQERLADLVATVAARKSKTIRIETTPASDAIANGALLPGANAALGGPAFFDWLTSEARSRSTLEMLLSVAPTSMPSPSQVMTATIELPPGDPGTPPHRHSGPVFGYMLEGEMVFELEGEAERIVRAGEAFWEPGGDVIHYQAANHLADARSRFVVVMMGVPGKPMLELVHADELHARRNRRGAPGDANPTRD